MVGAFDSSGSGLGVSSWGWSDIDGCPTTRDAATFRLWSVSQDDEGRIAMLLLPIDKDSSEALGVAYRAWGPQ